MSGRQCTSFFICDVMYTCRVGIKLNVIVKYHFIYHRIQDSS